MVREVQPPTFVLHRFVAASLFAFALIACSSGPTPPGEGTCTFEELPAGATMRYYVAGGIDGRMTSVTAYADGRVEVKKKTDPAPRVALVGVERVQRLGSDLTATGAEDEDQGCYSSDSDEPEYDGIGSGLEFRTAGGLFRFQSGGVEMPDEVNDAFAVAGRFLEEVDPQAR